MLPDVLTDFAPARRFELLGRSAVVRLESPLLDAPLQRAQLSFGESLSSPIDTEDARLRATVPSLTRSIAEVLMERVRCASYQ